MNPHLQLMLQQAIQAFQEGNFDRADSNLKKVLQVDSKNLPALHILGLIKASQANYKEAADYLARAARIHPDDASIQYNLAKALADSGNNKEALVHNKKAVSLAPHNPEAWLSYGKIASNLGRYEDALNWYGNAIRLKPDYAEALLNIGATHKELKRYEEAIGFAEQALVINPNLPQAWSNKGIALKELKRFDEALDHYDKALSLKPDYAEAWTNKGVTLHELKRFDEALDHYDKALSLKPDYAEAWTNKGVTLHELKRFDEALDHYDKALSLKPDYAEAWTNKGVTLHELKRFDEALDHYDKALSLKPDYAEAWTNKGVTLHELKRFDEALDHYDKALSLKPDYAEGWLKKGNSQYALNKYDEAIIHFDKALSLKPDYAEGWNNKGNSLHALKKYDEAIIHFDKALSLKPDYAEGWYNKGATLNDLKRYDEVITHCDKALSLKPDIDWVLGDLIHAKMKIGNWSDLADDYKNMAKMVFENKKVTTPFALLAVSDDPLLHKNATQIFIQNKFLLGESLGQISKNVRKEKIRIAYFSPDFKSHPVSFLTAELFELHDRSKFEVFAFSLQQAPAGDEMNLRLKKSFDQFIELDSFSDKQIAELAREMKVDIAIDLTGLTQYSRTGIFSYRPAPIQVNWLGYPGTIGADFIDYIIADQTIIPKNNQHFYSEKVVHLPHTYMVDDSKRLPSTRVFTRDECGLPENLFIFCCFNNDFKFNPQVLDGWARILIAVKNSAIWISENNALFRSNLVLEFKKRGVESSRIIFAQRVESMEDHLARFALADLFLDTHPYNAHTTAIDSLKAGVPLVTLMGQSFASRVAGSLLNAVGLPGLITNTQKEYEALAIELAMNPMKLMDIKLKLTNNCNNSPLFNTPLFTKNIEMAFNEMYERYQAGLKPEHITIN